MPSILIVEDDFDVREALALILSGEGYLVTTADDGDEALRRLRSKPPFRPDLILLDVLMPKMDGVTLLRELRASPMRHVPAVVMTGLEDPSLGHALQVPVVKKSDLDSILTMVRRHTRRGPRRMPNFLDKVVAL